LCYTRLPLGGTVANPADRGLSFSVWPEKPEDFPCFTKNEISMITLFSAKNFDTLSNFTVCIQIKYIPIYN